MTQHDDHHDEPERRDLGQGAWTSYDADWLNQSEADLYFDTLHAELDWRARHIVARGKEVLQPRLMSWAGDLPYLYSGQTLEACPMHPVLAQLGARLEARCGVRFNHVVANLYRDGRDRVGFHADDEPELGYEPLIASVSLGATRRFVMRYKYKPRRRKYTERLTHGSLLLMGGTSQHRWYHGVPGDAEVSEPRINLTYRLLRGAPGWRAPRAEDPRQQRRAPTLTQPSPEHKE